MEDGVVQKTEDGTPQGGCISPCLANIYLHYTLDLWVEQWVKRKARGKVYIIRFADDFILGFHNERDAQALHKELETRMREFDLELHPEKTRLVEFGRYASKKAKRKGRKPETFKFLGLVHACGRRRNGAFEVVRITDQKKRQAKTQEIKKELRKRMHDEVPEVGKWLGTVVRGHCQYYGVPGNSKALWRFRLDIGRMWLRVLRRRSQKHALTWERMARLIKKYIPPCRITHPYPRLRFRVIT